MKKFLLFLLLIPAWAKAQTPITPSFARVNTQTGINDSLRTTYSGQITPQWWWSSSQIRKYVNSGTNPFTIAIKHYADSLHALQGNLATSNTWTGNNTFTGGLTTTTDFTVTNANGHSNNNTGDKITFDMVESIGKRAGGGLQFIGNPQIFQNNSGVQMLHLETGSIYAPYFAVNSAPSNGTDVVRLQDLPGGAINNTYSKSQTDSVAKAKWLHVLIAGGQSNELGSSQQPSLATPVLSTSGFKYNNLTASMQGAGEPYGASNGSMFNAYINTYYNATKIRPYVVMTAIGSTGMTASDGSVVGCWDTQGGCTLTTQSIARADSAIAIAVAAGYKIADVTIVFGQGETSGSSPSFNTNNYVAAISRVKNAYVAHYGNSITKFVVVRTGEYGSGYTPYRPVRLAQEIFADTASNTIMGYRGAVKFYQRGYMRSDSTHWTQTGQNEAGVYVARADVGGVKTPFSYEYNNGSVNNYYSAINDPMYKVGKPTPIDVYNVLHVSDSTAVVSNVASNGISNEQVVATSAASTGQLRGIKNYFTVNNSGFNLTNSGGGVVPLFNVGRLNGGGVTTLLLNNYSQFQNIGSGTLTTGINTYIENASNTGGGSITNNIGLFIKQQGAGTNNTQIQIGNTTVGAPTGNWSIYNNSANQSYAGVTNVQAFGTAQEFFNAAYDATNYSKYRMYWASASQFNITALTGGTGSVGDLQLGSQTTSRYFKIQQSTLGTFGSVFLQDHGTTSGSQVITSNVTGNFTAAGNNVYSLAVTPTLAMSGTAGWSGLIISPQVTSTGSGSNFLFRAGTNSAAKGTGTHTDLFTISTAGVVNISGLTVSKAVFTDASKNLTSTGPGTTSQYIDGTGSLQTLPAKTAVVRSSASALTIAYGTDYVFTGTTTTYTLPAVGTATRADFITIKNAGSGNITLNSNTGSTIYDTSLVSSITIAPGSSVTLVPDGTQFNKE